MSQESQFIPAPVIWAQRANIVYLTVCLEDCKNPDIDIKPEKIHFKGVGGTESKMHEFTINFYKNIDPNKTVQSAKERLYELILYKAEEGPYWPRLTKEDKKFHWIKSDFNKWKDEDESDEEGEAPTPDLESVMRDMGYMGGMDENKPSIGDDEDFDVDGESPDSDDDALPDLE